MLPEIPWVSDSGTSFADLQGRADSLLFRLESAIAGRGLRDQVEVTMLAAEMAENNAALRDLAQSELAVDALIEFGSTRERHRRRGRLRPV